MTLCHRIKSITSTRRRVKEKKQQYNALSFNEEAAISKPPSPENKGKCSGDDVHWTRRDHQRQHQQPKTARRKILTKYFDWICNRSRTTTSATATNKRTKNKRKVITKQTIPGRRQEPKQQRTRRSKNNIMHPFALAVGKVIEVTDVDGIVRRIDVNDVVQRIEWNDVLDRIDFNAVLDKIDWDEQLERIDVESVLRRIDTTSIVARSSTGIVTQFLDTVRTQLVLLDLYLWIVTRCRFWTRTSRIERCFLPPSPGRHAQRYDRQVYPKGRTNKAIAVQGRYCGFVSKTIAIMIDMFTITVLFALLFQLIEWCFVLFLGESRIDAANKTHDFRQNAGLFMVVVYGLYWFGYFFLAIILAGQTLGMMIVGLKVCNCQRTDPYSNVTPSQALIRTALLPITLTLCPPLGVIGVFRRDGRMLHDLVAETGMIFLWDAKLAKYRHRVMREERGESVISDEDAPDELDNIIENENNNDHDHNDDHDDSYTNEETGFVGQEVTLKQDSRLDRRTNHNKRNRTSSTSDVEYSTFQTKDNEVVDKASCCPLLG